MKKSLFFLAIFSLVVLMYSCGGSTTVVESGTYNGKIKKIEAEKTEIYVTLEDNNTIELYFTEETTLTKDGNTVEFSALEEGQSVQVEVEKVGKRLDPISVKILE